MDGDIPLSGSDLNKYIKEVEKTGVNLFQSKDIHKNTDIDDIFNNSGHTILFQDNKDGSGIGHWICMLRKPGCVYWIDSYGKGPDYYNKNVIPCLKNNKKNGVEKLYINDMKLQGGNSMTCGRYGIIFVSLHKMGYPPEKMIEFLMQGGKQEGSVDKFILKLFGTK